MINGVYTLRITRWLEAEIDVGFSINLVNAAGEELWMRSLDDPRLPGFILESARQSTPRWTSSEKPARGKPGYEVGRNEHQAQYQAEYASHKLKTEYANLLREADEMGHGGLVRPDNFPETLEGNGHAPDHGDRVPELYSSDPTLDLTPPTPPPPPTPDRRSRYPEQEGETGTPRPPQRETSIEPNDVGTQEQPQPPLGSSVLRSPHRFYDEDLEILRRDEELGYLLGGRDSDAASLSGRSVDTNRTVSDNFISDGAISDGYDSDGAVTDADDDSDDTVVPTVLDTHEGEHPLDVETGQLSVDMEVDDPSYFQSEIQSESLSPEMDTDRESLSPEMDIDAPTEHDHEERQGSAPIDNPDFSLQSGSDQSQFPDTPDHDHGERQGSAPANDPQAGLQAGNDRSHLLNSTEDGHNEEQVSAPVETPNNTGLQVEQDQPQPPAPIHTPPQAAAPTIITEPAAPANAPAIPAVPAAPQNAGPTAAELAVERWPAGMPFNNSTGRGPDGEPLPETPLTEAELGVIRTLIPAHVRAILEDPDPGFTVTFQHDGGPYLTADEVITAISIFVEYYLGDVVFRGERRREMSRDTLLKYIRNDPRINEHVQLRRMSYQQWKHQTWDRLMGARKTSLKRRAMLCLARHYYPKDRIAARRQITK